MSLPAPPPLVTQTLAERTAERLRQKITRGEFAPGQRLSEQALSDHLGTSRNTLREVFRILGKEGLVKHSLNRGVFVTVPDIAAIIDIYRVRRLIECQALANAYSCHPAQKKMHAEVDNALRCRAAGDWVGVGTANMDFHMAIVELADSERLNQLFASVLAELRLAFGLLRDPELLHAPYVDMNATLLALVETGNFAKAASALNDYLLQSERIVLAVFARHIESDAQKG